MSKSNVTALAGRPQLGWLLMSILVFGSIWGMSEVALGGILGAVGFPYRAALLTGVGMGILALAYAVSKSLPALLGIGMVAVLVNLLGVPIMHLTVMCKANSCIAVFAEATGLALMAALLMKKDGGGVYRRMAGGASAAILASVGFYVIGTHVAPCKYLSSFANTGAFLVREGLVWAAFAAVFVPLGYVIGEKLAARSPIAKMERSLVYYAAGAGIIVSSLATSALAILAGL